MTFEQNDQGNAKRFAARWRGQVAFQDSDELWMVWGTGYIWGDGWVRSDETELLEHAMVVVDEMRAEADANNDYKLRQWAKKTGEVPRLKRMLTLARFYLTATYEELDLVQSMRGLRYRKAVEWDERKSGINTLM